MYKDTEMYQVASETEKVKCDQCLKIYQTPRPAPADHTESIASQGWPTFSTAGSVSSIIDSEVENKEFKTAFDAFLLYFGKSIMKQKLFANGKKTINSRQRRKRKREEDRNTSEKDDRNTSEKDDRNTSEKDDKNTSEKAVYQEPVTKKEDSLCNEDYFYFDISRQKAIEILKTGGKEKEFLLRESYKENAPYEICLLKEKHIFILTILCTENKIPSEYYMSDKVYKLRNTKGLNFGLSYLKVEWETKRFAKIQDLVKFLLDCDFMTKTLDKKICKQNAMISAKEGYQNFRNHFCHQCNEYQSKTHYCQFSQNWIHFDEKNLIIIQGKTRASVERKAGFEKEILEDEELKEDTKEEDPKFRKMQFDGISIFRSKYEMNISLKEQRNLIELTERDQNTLKKALLGILPVVEFYVLKPATVVGWDIYHSISKRIKGIQKMVPGLLHIIKPLIHNPVKLSSDILTNKVNAALEALMGQDKFFAFLKVEADGKLRQMAKLSSLPAPAIPSPSSG